MTDAAPDSGQSSGAGRGGPNEDFVRLFTTIQRPLYLSILPMVHTPADAEEVLQEANVVILSKWAQFTPGTNFLAWARAIARLEVLRFRRRSFHRVQLLDDDVIELIAEKLEAEQLDLDEHREALVHCVGRLRQADQDLIRRRYAAGANGDRVAGDLGRPANSVYQSLGRIRRMLVECVRRRLAGGGAT